MQFHQCLLHIRYGLIHAVAQLTCRSRTATTYRQRSQLRRDLSNVQAVMCPQQPACPVVVKSCIFNNGTCPSMVRTSLPMSDEPCANCRERRTVETHLAKSGR